MYWWLCYFRSSIGIGLSGPVEVCHHFLLPLLDFVLLPSNWRAVLVVVDQSGPGAELQYLRQLWHGGEARFGFNLVWFETNGGRVDRREGDAEMWHRGELLHRDTFVAAFANNFFVKEQVPTWLMERWRPFDEVFSTWMQSRWTMLPGLTISWPALQKGDFDVWQLLSEGAIIDGN